MVGLDGESDSRIKEILTDGSIPVLRVTKGHKRNYASSIKVFDKAHAKPYVAISHVWCVLLSYKVYCRGRFLTS